MDNVDIEVLKTCAQWLSENRPCVLVTVVKTWGSSPRPAGAMMVIDDQGRVVGSVSGGCVEDDLIHRVHEGKMFAALPVSVIYGGTVSDAQSFGIPCGGTLQLMCETLSSQSQIEALLEQLSNTKTVTLIERRLDLHTGKVTLTPASNDQSPQLTQTMLCTIHGPRWRLIVIGAGQLSRFLAQIALGLGYQITVCDPREEYANTWDITGTELTRNMPDDVVIEMQPDCRTAVVALTHDPKLDDLALMEALKSDAFYVGALGSINNNIKRRQRLELFDLTPEQIAKMHGPIGLQIGSKTPPEIAISILAQMTAIKNAIKL
jgi:xanthine dehydrogenase accessory factor